jgi:osmotically-inducible protein OsmY
VTLARKVETEIFRAADAPKGSVSVNAENGVVFLRGTVDDRAWIERLGAEAKNVDGVEAVRNLLHLPGTEAPVAPGVR